MTKTRCANHPWNLISLVSDETQVQGTDVILVAPVWKAQPWYALLQAMLVDWLHLLTKQSTRTQLDTMTLDPQLAIQSISGRSSKVQAFLAKLQNLSSSHGGVRLLLLLLMLQWILGYPNFDYLNP